MSNEILCIAFIAFSLFIITKKYRVYAAIAGWSCIVLNLLFEIPAFIRESNFLYPTLALLSVPFLIITAQHLFRRDPVADRLSVSAAVATIIYVPFALVPVLQELLIRAVITLVFFIVSTLGHHPSWGAWDIIAENGFYNQIILGCTGILAVALMIGVIAGVQNTPFRNRLYAITLVTPLILFLNLFRVAGVFIAVSDRWFDELPDPTGTGNANFFWAHNVIAEGLALLFLIVLVMMFCYLLPDLSRYSRDVWRMYTREISGLVSDRGGGK